jgi:steroid 5-alpha reductase family enzyme
MREHWGERQQLGMLVFFQAQSIFVILFSLPQWAVAQTSAPLGTTAALLAVLIWLISVGGESLADSQLDAFKRRPDAPGKTCRVGLWRYSRHPNYFFEWLGWFIWPVLAWPGSGFYITLLGPVLMFIFLVKLTGIPYTERQALKSRGADYAEYQRTTSAFFPWPPKLDS